MKLLSSSSQIKLYQLIRLLEELQLVGDNVISHFPEGNYSFALFIRVNLFRRYIDRLKVLLPLLKIWENETYVEDSVGTIIRASLADVLMQFYLEDIHSKVKVCPSPEEDAYLRTVNALLADHIYSGIAYHKSTREAGVFNEKFYKERIDDWKRLYPMFFKDEPIDYNNPIKNISAERFPSPAFILKAIRHSEMLSKFRIDQLYIGYFFYSKYEHYGATTNSIQTTDMNILFYFMIDSLGYVLLACQLCMGHFISNFKIFEEEHSKIYSIREEFIRISNIARPFVDPVPHS